MNDPRPTILRALTRVVHRRPPEEVVFAEAEAAPPLNAFVVNFPSLVMVLDGTYEIEMSRNHEISQQELTEGHILYTRPNCWYRPQWSKASKVLTILFGVKQTGFSLVRTRVGRDGQPVLGVAKWHTSVPLSNLSRELLHLCEQAAEPFHDRRIAVHLVHALLLSCIELLGQHTEQGTTRAQQVYESVCSYVQEHFHRLLTRESVAAAFDITPNHLSRLFRTQGLMRFWDYVTLVRIDRAKLLLIQYDLSIKEISLRCGFAESSYFCRVFRHRTKLSPAEYRRKYRRRR